MTIEFKNGLTVNYLNAIETEEFFNGASRRTLTIECAPDAMGVDSLNFILSNEDNLKELKLLNGEITNIYTDYVLKLELGIKSKLTAPQTSQTPEIYSDRLIFKLGKRTYIEQMLKNLGV